MGRPVPPNSGGGLADSAAAHDVSAGATAAVVPAGRGLPHESLVQVEVVVVLVMLDDGRLLDGRGRGGRPERTDVAPLPPPGVLLDGGRGSVAGPPAGEGD